MCKEQNPDTVSSSILRAPGHSGRCVPGCEGPEAGDIVEGGCFAVEWRAGGGPACSVGEPSAEAAGAGRCCRAQRRTGCGETSAHGHLSSLKHFFVIILGCLHAQSCPS